DRQGDQDLDRVPSRDRGGGVLRASGAGLHARLRARAREILEARRRPGDEDVPAPPAPVACGAGRRDHAVIPSLSPREKATHDLVFTAAVTLVALLPRLYVAIAWGKEPVWDAHYYHLGAERLAAGLGYSEDVMVGGHVLWKPWVHYPVGYSLF